MVKFTKAAIYARISRDITGEGLGVERQLQDCRKLAADRGWVVAEEYVDNDVSAYSGKTRPDYERMLEDIAAGERDAVIVYHTDRLARRPIDLEQFTGVCDKAGVSMLATVGQDIDMTKGDGMLMARIQGAFAAQESSRKSERLRRKARQTAEMGLPNGGFHRPYGYEKDRVTVVESEAEVVRQLVGRYLAGESMMSMVNSLHEAEVRSVTGALWNTTTLRNILKSARYAGLRTHGGEVVATAVWPAIITPAQHAQVLAQFESKKITGRRAARRYLLSGMLRCGKCGNKLFSSARREGSRNVRRYVCMSGPDHRGCGGLMIVAAPVEEWLSEAVLLRLDTPVMADALAGKLADDEHHAALMTERTGHLQQMDELRQLWTDRQISTAEWIPARNEIEGRIEAVDRQLQHILGSNTLDGLVGQGSELRQRWESLNLSRQNAIMRAVLDYATITPGIPNVRVFTPERIVPTWRL